jgi:flagellum-specific peptidoglycan hydrolase FlgJ
MNNCKTFLLCVVLAVPVGLCAQKISRSEYIERYKDIAVAHAEKYGIPASIKMAQGILESGDGNGTLARRGNTHFNIKVKPSDNWRGEVIRHDDDRPNEAFRAYSTAEDSWIDHSEYLNSQPRYDSLFRYDVTDYRSWARGLKNCGYATDPLYAEKLIRIIEDNELWRLDQGVAWSEKALARREDEEKPTLASNIPAGGIDPDRFVVTVERPEKHKRRKR